MSIKKNLLAAAAVVALAFAALPAFASANPCTTPGQAAGTITTTALEFHLVAATDANGVKKKTVC